MSIFRNLREISAYECLDIISIQLYSQVLIVHIEPPNTNVTDSLYE